MYKKLFTLVLLSFLCLFFTFSSVFATTGAYAGVGTYNFCGFGNRAGDVYVENLASKLYENNGKPNRVAAYTCIKNADVFPSRIAEIADEDLFVFSGHGVRYDYSPLLNNMATLHTYASSTSDTWHTGSDANQFGGTYNFSWNEWPSVSARWGVFYSCNWLANGGSTTIDQIMFSNLFKGTLHLAVGFGSRMYLDSREANLFGDNLRNNFTIKNSWFDAASRYQPQLDPSSSTYNNSVVARVCGYTSAGNDTFSTYYTSNGSSVVPSYNNAPGSYTTWNRIIPCTGNII